MTPELETTALVRQLQDGHHIGDVVVFPSVPFVDTRSAVPFYMPQNFTDAVSVVLVLPSRHQRDRHRMFRERLADLVNGFAETGLYEVLLIEESLEPFVWQWRTEFAHSRPYHTLLLFSDDNPLRLKYTEQATLLLASRKGHILWQETEPFTGAMLAEIRNILKVSHEKN
jgi:hypothetical protein